MPFRETAGLTSFYFQSFDRPDIVQGIFTRHGGISPAPWNSLNLGGTVGDERDNVVENRRRIFQASGRPVESIYDPWQVHGTDVIVVEKPRPLNNSHLKADAIITDRPEVSLFMRFADCVPIALFDPKHAAIGLVHAGWRGTVAAVAAAAVKSMVAQYGCVPEDILAGIGPSICLEHYQVGEEVIHAAQEAFGTDANRVLWEHRGSQHFDLWQANQIVLERSGVRQIEQARICTFCQNKDWYSHRAEQGKTGRFGAILGRNQVGVGNYDADGNHSE